MNFNKPAAERGKTLNKSLQEFLKQSMRVSVSRALVQMLHQAS